MGRKLTAPIIATTSLLMLLQSWYAYMQNDVLATGIMSFVMHEAVYFGRSIPWIIIDAIPYFNKYKIQGVMLLRKAILIFGALRPQGSSRILEIRQARAGQQGP